MPARFVVEKAWEKREEFHPSGEFLHLESPCPWKDHLYDLESENKKEELIKFVFYGDERGMHRIQTVAPRGNHFGQRVPLAKAWRGLRNEELKKFDASL